MFFDFKKDTFVIINVYSTAVVYNVITGLKQEKPFCITYLICNTCFLELSRFKIKHVLRHEGNIAIRHVPFYLKNALLTHNAA